MKKGKGGRKTRKRQGIGSHFPLSPRLPWSPTPFEAIVFILKHNFVVVWQEKKGKREEGGRLREKAWEGKGRESPSPFSLISPPWFPRHPPPPAPFPLHFLHLPRSLTLSYGLLSFVSFTTDNFWKCNAIYSINPIYIIGIAKLFRNPTVSSFEHCILRSLLFLNVIHS